MLFSTEVGRKQKEIEDRQCVSRDPRHGMVCTLASQRQQRHRSSSRATLKGALEDVMVRTHRQSLDVKSTLGLSRLISTEHGTMRF